MDLATLAEDAPRPPGPGAPATAAKPRAVRAGAANGAGAAARLVRRRARPEAPARQRAVAPGERRRRARVEPELRRAPRPALPPQVDLGMEAYLFEFDLTAYRPLLQRASGMAKPLPRCTRRWASSTASPVLRRNVGFFCEPGDSYGYFFSAARRPTRSVPELRRLLATGQRPFKRYRTMESSSTTTRAARTTSRTTATTSSGSTPAWACSPSPTAPSAPSA